MSDDVIRRTVITTLQMLGLESGYCSYNRASKLWGKAFRQAAREGKIKPISKGDGRNGKLTYDINTIITTLYER